MVQREGTDEWEVLVSMTELLEGDSESGTSNLDNEHVVIYSGDVGMHRLEYVLLAHARSTLGFFTPPPLQRSRGTLVLSIGGGTGVRMGFAND